MKISLLCQRHYWFCQRDADVLKYGLEVKGIQFVFQLKRHYILGYRTGTKERNHIVQITKNDLKKQKFLSRIMRSVITRWLNLGSTTLLKRLRNRERQDTFGNAHPLSFGHGNAENQSFVNPSPVERAACTSSITCPHPLLHSCCSLFLSFAVQPINQGLCPLGTHWYWNAEFVIWQMGWGYWSAYRMCRQYHNDNTMLNSDSLI